MKHERKAKNGISVCRFLSVCLMIFCLAFLTSVNFFIYSCDKETISENISNSDTEESGNDFPPSGATEEKTSNSGLSVSEEILHEITPEFNFLAIDHIYLHHIAETDKIELFHPELVSPPPKI
jgi:hypothetical protein